MNPKIQALLERAKATVARVEAEGRHITDEEKQQIERLIAEAKSLGETEAKTREINRLLGSGGNGDGGLFAAFKAAGWAPGKRVSVPREHLKTASFTGDPDDLDPSRREGAALGFDQRYLADVFPSVGLAPDVTSVQVMRQASRTLPAPADVQRALLATTEKAEVGSMREMVSESVIQLAAKESAVPNVLLLQDGVRSMIDVDLRLAILEAKDDAIMDAIGAANPPSSSLGVGLIEEVRFAIADMRDDGYNPAVLALNPLQAANFDLTQTAGPEGFYLFAPTDSGKAWRLRIVESKSILDPLLIDPSAAGRRYEGPLSLQSFEENDGATNTSLVRLEQNFLAHIERTNAIRKVVTGGS